MRIRHAFLVLLWLVACRSSQPGTMSTVNSHTNDGAIIASAKADIDAANDDWVPAMRRRDAEAIAAAYADDGLFIARDGTVVHGREAVAKMYAARFPRMGEIVDGGIVQDGVTAVGPAMIYEWGHAWLELAPVSPGQQPVRSGGNYLTVWQRAGDGHWRITRNIAF